MPDHKEGDEESSATVDPHSDISNGGADTDSASFNISRSKKLIEMLAETTRRSASVVERGRSFRETHKMLSVSKTMSDKSKAQLKNAAEKRKNESGKTEKP